LFTRFAFYVNNLTLETYAFLLYYELMEKKKVGRVLGIDFGTKRIGVALCDENRQMALPFSVVPNDKMVIANISKIIRDKGVELVVIGESKDFKMIDNPIMESVRSFESLLAIETGVEIDYEPEFLTSHQAHHVQGKTKMLDASAATIILQSYLDRHGIHNK
jgi:putative Holliday junction resolvase